MTPAEPAILQWRPGPFWRRWRRFLSSSTFLLALVICWRWWPPPATADMEEGLELYRSTGTLLLKGQDQSALAQVLGVADDEELNLWLGNEEMFERFLERNRVREKIALRLRDHPQLQAFGREVSIRPIYRTRWQRSTSRNVQMGPLYAGQELEDLDEGGEGPVERDYVTLTQGNEKGWQQVQRASRVVMLASAPRPEEAQQIAVLALETFQKVLEEVAVARVRRQRQAAEGYLKLTRKRIAKAEENLKGLVGRRTRQLEERTTAEAEIVSLRERRGVLERELALATQRIESARRDFFLVNSEAASTVLESRQHSLLIAQQIYNPDSVAIGNLEATYKLAQRWARSLADETRARKLLQLEEVVGVKRRLLAEVDLQLQQELACLPSMKARQDYETALRELSGWESELLSWEQQLIQIRIQEQVAKGHVSAFVVQDPLPGTRPLFRVPRWTQRYRKVLRFLPVAPLAALVLAIVLEVWSEGQRIRRRAAYYCAAPILAELPAIERQERKSWQLVKRRGAQEVRTKSEP